MTVIGGAIFGVLLIIIIVATRKGPTNDDRDGVREKHSHSTAGIDTSPSVSQSATGVTSVASSPDVKQETQMALGRIASGEIDAGTKDLESLAKRYPDDPFVLRSLASTYSKQNNQTAALGVVTKLLKAVPDAASDTAIDPIFDAALVTTATPAVIDAVFAILQNDMGGEGARILYDIAYGKRGFEAIRERAKKALADKAMLEKMKPAIRGAYDLRIALASPLAKRCASVREVIEKHRHDFDARGLEAMGPLKNTKGCGNFIKSDCWPCLREGKLFDTVYKEVEDRTSAAPK
jgi:hypothetical protein